MHINISTQHSFIIKRLQDGYKKKNPDRTNQSREFVKQGKLTMDINYYKQRRNT